MSVQVFAEMEASVGLCNERAVVLEEYRKYEEMANQEFLSAEAYRDVFFDANAPKTFFGIASFILSLVCFMVPTWLFLLNINASDPVQAIVSLIALIIGIICFYKLGFKRIYCSLHKADLQKYEDAKQEHAETLPAINILCNTAKRRLMELEAKMENDEYCIIPKKYWHIANELYLLIKNKRATDIVSAINKYEDIQHQIRMEGMAAQSLAYSEMTMYAAEQARINSQIAAERAQKAALYSGLNLLYNIYTDTEK